MAVPTLGAAFFLSTVLLLPRPHIYMKKIPLEACPMKKLIAALFFAALLVSIYVDLTAGTLTVSIAAPPEKSAQSSAPEIPSFTASVRPGQTLLSIVEKKRGVSADVSIGKLIADFKSLNPGASPELLQIGKEYRFPDYER